MLISNELNSLTHSLSSPPWFLGQRNSQPKKWAQHNINENESIRAVFAATLVLIQRLSLSLILPAHNPTKSMLSVWYVSNWAFFFRGSEKKLKMVKESLSVASDL